MSWVIYIFGSGAAFFLGVAFVLGSVPIMSSRRWKALPLIATMFAVIGIVLVVISATPLPYWLYAVAIVATLAWVVLERLRLSALGTGWQIALRIAVVVIWLTTVALEVPYLFVPSLEPARAASLHLFADSVSAGMGEAAAQTWPHMLARSRGIELHDHSHMGATVGSMLRRAQGLTLDDGLILLEIGGNDLLGSTSAADYERQLDELLDVVCGADRIVVMFELPLPPFRNEYGRAQRRLAAKRGVLLVPKRVFVGVLTAEGATVDSIHLTPAGHERMAQCVWQIIQPAFANVPPGP